MDELGQRRRDWLRTRRLYFICGGGRSDEALEGLLRSALQGGVDIVQLRDKDASESQIVRAGRIYRRLCDAYDALFIVNDRPDLAVACAADGVHLGQDDGSVERARELVGDDMLIGVSTHSKEQVDLVAGADYFAVGPVHATPTKPAYEPVGLELVRYAAHAADLPFFAIGGVDTSNAAGVAAAGAGRIAVVRAIRDAADPRSAAEGILQAMTRHPTQPRVRS